MVSVRCASPSLRSACRLPLPAGCVSAPPRAAERCPHTPLIYQTTPAPRPPPQCPLSSLVHSSPGSNATPYSRLPCASCTGAAPARLPRRQVSSRGAVGGFVEASAEGRDVSG
jgi:hypothetical protein